MAFFFRAINDQIIIITIIVVVIDVIVVRRRRRSHHRPLSVWLHAFVTNGRSHQRLGVMAQNRDPRQYAISQLTVWSKQGYDVSPTDEDQVRLFMQLRGGCADNGRLTPRLFSKWRLSAKDESSMSAALSLRAIGIPKSQFPDGLPGALKGAELLPEELAEYELTGGNLGSLDLANYYVMGYHAVKDKSGLGRFVPEFTFRHMSAKRLKVSMQKEKAASGGGNLPGNPPASSGPPASGGPPATPPATGGADSDTRAPKRNLSYPFEPDAEPPEVKRARLRREVLLSAKSKLKTAIEDRETTTIT